MTLPIHGSYRFLQTGVTYVRTFTTVGKGTRRRHRRRIHRNDRRPCVRGGPTFDRRRHRGRERAAREEAGNALYVGQGARYESHEAMLDEEELDAVLIGTPHVFHYEQIMDALDQGLHVLCDKPLTTDREKAREVVQRSEAAEDQVLMVGYQRHETRRSSRRATDGPKPTCRRTSSPRKSRRTGFPGSRTRGEPTPTSRAAATSTIREAISSTRSSGRRA
nr:Gfo/Idh/MocA family oxidoreductase [Haladaptatus sp. R4]